MYNKCMGIIRKSYRFVPWSQRFFLIFLLERDQEQAAKAVTTSRESDEEREKNLWWPWPRISPSCGRQGQDLILGRWLVDIFSNTLTNLIGLFNCNYRGDAEDFLTSFPKLDFASLYQGRKLFVYCTRNNLCRGPRHVKARHVSRFWHGCCSWRIFKEILTSVLDKNFPESHWATKESFVHRLELKGFVHHFINRTCKVYNISVVTCCLQVPFLKRILIPSPCNNFGCLSSQVSCGLAYPRTAKPWRLSNQFEQSRRWRPESRVSMYLPFSVTILSFH